MRNLKPLSRPVFLSLWHVKGLLSKRTALKADVTGPENRLFAVASLHHPARNFTCWGSEGVNDGGRWGRGRLYTYRYTVTTRMTPALRWAATRAILMFYNYEGQGHKTLPTNHKLSEEKAEPKRYRTEVLLLTSLPPYR